MATIDLCDVDEASKIGIAVMATGQTVTATPEKIFSVLESKGHTGLNVIEPMISEQLGT